MVDKETFRHVIGHFASGVTVLTTHSDDEDFGATASTVSSLSLEPPMAVRLVVVGNFRFGRRGAGRVVTLRELSSTAHLGGVEVGTVEVATRLLGRPYEVTGALRAVGRRWPRSSFRQRGPCPRRADTWARFECVAGVTIDGNHRDSRHALTVHHDVDAADRPRGLAHVGFGRRL
ncbi:flavin reductase [Pseudonocardia asaccharolytica]|uniref:Flavin reductase like domain-containing protein n=1 Tax=Pseudonocardia asaccharolytica DSM 44247 = NBRC 16224 TaxID=1123024 RepID=A0A511D4U5_9PSEU|nr:flavin reductase [Pseudonocardia asaccharolytica]GEL19820.1 hypothetical protein PA7_36570 [Pseudonocardia asaccharolytica DSM 44247 = NBRC 16224]